MGAAGLEQPPVFSNKKPCFDTGGAESGALHGDLPINADLRKVIDAWPRLSEQARRQIMAIAAAEVSLKIES